MYQVIDTKTNTTVKDGYKSRRTAKVKRDKMLEGKPDGLSQARYIVSRGVAHPRGPSNGINVQEPGRFVSY